jgi:hypothetical protein
MHLISILLIAASLGASANEISVIGRLKWIPHAVPACGVFESWSVTEYEVIRVLKGNYKGRKIYVVHPCIEQPRTGSAGNLRKFEIGDQHKLILTRENNSGNGEKGVIGADKIENGYAMYWSKRVEKHGKWRFWVSRD